MFIVRTQKYHHIIKMDIDFKIVIGIIVFFIVVWYFFKPKENTTVEKKSDDTSVSGGTIYGVMTCPYTVKQVEKYPGYDFVDCSSGNCPEFVTAFPTTKHADGNIVVGFS